MAKLETFLTIADLDRALKGLPRDAPIVLRIGGKIYPWTHVTAGYVSSGLSESTVNPGTYAVVLAAGEGKDEP